ncbi:MAG TPA: 2-phosphoglycerate kinase [Actinobacteria bacterium]|nr:2-phosphoglycerate kinase [Actinomycetota bacterium]
MTRKGDFFQKRIVIRDERHGLPYSKGIMASSIMATGIPPKRAYRMSELVEERLKESNRFSVSTNELRDVVVGVLREHVGEEHVQRYVRWQSLGKLEKPLIILIGGTTGVGKSTIATEIAHRLGITRVVSTDALREVMRAIFSKELMPTLYDSSFSAWRGLREPLPAATDPVIVGFREQTIAVAVGMKAVIDRAIREGLNLVVEGVHIVPGFIDSKHFKSAFVVHLIITVEDENLHRSHFYIREMETEGFRPFERYRANFDSIRKIGKYIEDLSREKGIPIISSRNLDTTVAMVLEEILNQVFPPLEGGEAALAPEREVL